MKRFFVLLLLLPSLGSCTIEGDYYDHYYWRPDATIVTPYVVHPHYRPVPIPRRHHYHHRKRVIIIPAKPRRVIPYVRPRVRPKVRVHVYGNGHLHGHS
jgi:hypothetical protein